jgi:hypothetical protein
MSGWEHHELRLEALMAARGHEPLIRDGVRFPRVTCGACRRAALNPAGLDYGSALDEPCPGPPSAPERDGYRAPWPTVDGRPPWEARR